MERKYKVDSINVDFIKVLDSVNHYLLIDNLKYFSILGYFQNCFVSFLANRVQYSKFINFISVAIEVHSVVLQRSHLVSLLFILFINDFCFKVTKIHFFLLADDLKIFNL